MQLLQYKYDNIQEISFDLNACDDISMLQTAYDNLARYNLVLHFTDMLFIFAYVANVMESNTILSSSVSSSLESDVHQGLHYLLQILAEQMFNNLLQHLCRYESSKEIELPSLGYHNDTSVQQTDAVSNVIVDLN